VVAQLLSADTPDEVQKEVFATIRTLELSDAVDELFAAVGDESRSGTARAAALQALDYFKDSRLEKAVEIASSSDSPDLRLAALPVAAKLSPEAVLPVLEILAVDGNTREHRAAYQSLANLEDPAADRILSERLGALQAGDVIPGAQIELLEAAAKRTDPVIAKLLADRDAAIAASGDPLAPFEQSLEGGDFIAGSRVFNNQPVMACQRCHQLGGQAVGAGPNLGLIGAKMNRRELLASIIEPNAIIAEGFESVVITTKNGDVNVGSIASESDSVLSLRLLDGSIAEISKEEITKRDGAPSGMPAIYQHVLTKREMRDLIQFLSMLKVEFGAGGGPRALTPFAGIQRLPEFDADEK
jgi:quinoprotein glucose dehydrogenase